ncbi:MAG TPA: helix-turn-helix domain-containing protein [Brevibacterium linens]|nr:helix-turn-helix domain-containing protein [Brevibacterium linens]
MRCYDRYRRGVGPVSPSKRHAVAQDKARLRDEITLRREAGQSIADIAAAVGMNTSTASRWLLEWDFEAGLTADELEELRRRQREADETPIDEILGLAADTGESEAERRARGEDSPE